MTTKSIKGNEETSEMIKKRRKELGLTVEEAAHRAGVSTKSWTRYEHGEPIRSNVYSNVCDALNVTDLEGCIDADIFEAEKELERIKKSCYWSQALADKYGEMAAASFAEGSTLLKQTLDRHMAQLESMPAGTHIGEIHSVLFNSLPHQFLTRYDYEFLYILRNTLDEMEREMSQKKEFTVCTAMDVIVLNLMVQRFKKHCQTICAELVHVCKKAKIGDECLIGCKTEEERQQERELFDSEKGGDLNWAEWVYDVFPGPGMMTYFNLYCDSVTPDSPYHFAHWLEPLPVPAENSTTG